MSVASVHITWQVAVTRSLSPGVKFGTYLALDNGNLGFSQRLCHAGLCARRGWRLRCVFALLLCFQLLQLRAQRLHSIDLALYIDAKASMRCAKNLPGWAWCVDQ